MRGPDPAGAPAWERGPWTWPAAAAERETGLQERLRALLGDPRIQFLDPAPGALAHLSAARVAT